MTEQRQQQREADGRDDARPGPKELSAPVVEVVVMEDRAQVTRRATVSLDAGVQTVRVPALTPLLADRTISCRVRAVEADDAAADTEPARLLDVQVHRGYRVRQKRPEAEQRITADLEALAEEYRAHFDDGQAMLHEHGVVKRVGSGLVRRLQDRLAVGRQTETWTDALDAVFSRRAEMEEQILSLQYDQDDRRLRFERLVDERAEAVEPMPEYRAELITELQVERPGRFELSWDYQVPCALWRPSYRAEWRAGVDGEAPSVRWESSGTVWQNTGEPWDGVNLSFSTARPTLGADLPLLEDDVLRTRDKSAYERQVIEVQSRDQAVAHTDDLPEQQRSDTPPGLDDGGEARVYQVPEPTTVPSDGRPHTVPFDRWTGAADTDQVCLPEQQLFVFVRSVQNNASDMPLLAGPVTLVRHGQYVGRSEIAYVAPGDRFALSWGSEDGLVVLRYVTRDQEQTTLTKTRLDTFQVEVYLVNHTGTPQELQLSERIPVSEIEKVKVELLNKATTPGYTVDDQGLVSWAITLAPGQERRTVSAHRVSLPHNVRWNG